MLHLNYKLETTLKPRWKIQTNSIIKANKCHFSQITLDLNTKFGFSVSLAIIVNQKFAVDTRTLCYSILILMGSVSYNWCFFLHV